MMMDFTEDPALAETILDIPFRYHLAAAKRLVEMGVDMIWIGDDFGTQSGMLISPRIWRQLFKPRMAEFISTLKTINPQVKVAYHSDGNIEKIIPDLIEIGLDVLNPVQPACMNPAKLKRDYGDKLCFWGTIDEQFTLPFGTADQVRAQVRGAPGNRRLRRRPDPRPHAPRAVGHAARKLLGHGPRHHRRTTTSLTTIRRRLCIRARLQSWRKGSKRTLGFSP